MEKNIKNGIIFLASIVIIVLIIGFAIIICESSIDKLTIRDCEEAEAGDWMEGWCYLKEGHFDEETETGILFLVDTNQQAEMEYITPNDIPVVIKENLAEELDHQNYFYMKAKKVNPVGDTTFLMPAEIYDENMVLIYESYGPF